MEVEVEGKVIQGDLAQKIQTFWNFWNFYRVLKYHSLKMQKINYCGTLV